MENLSLHLGARIKYMRKAQRLSQERLAEKAVIDAKFLSQLEVGKRMPSLGTVHKIAYSLGIPVRELFEFDHLSKGIRKELQELIMKMNEDQVQKAYRILKVLTE